MSENVPQYEFLAAFQKLEASFSPEQRFLILQYPQLINPALVPAFFQSSVNRMAEAQNEILHQSMQSAANTDGKVDERKPRKVVNSWMAFRTYYSSLMKDLPQKNRSPMLSALWKKDKDHGLWELLSAAFSYIRDNHEEDKVSLEQFLEVATQAIPVVRAARYFEATGWRREADAVVPIADHPKLSSRTTNLSCAGVVRFCFRAGLLSRAPTTKEADFKPGAGCKAPPSTIAFAAMASAPLAALAANPVQAVGVAQHIPATDDIEFTDNSSVYGALSASPAASASTSSNAASSPPDVQHFLADHDFTSYLPVESSGSFANMDMQDLLQSNTASARLVRYSCSLMVHHVIH